MSDNQKDFQNFIYPFALGCLDKEDFVSMVEYIEAGGDFPWQELGELQNLTALLPSFLNIETPQPSVKDRVARTLYKLKSEKVQEKKSPPSQTINKTGVYSGKAVPAGSPARDTEKSGLPPAGSGDELTTQSPRRTPEQSRPPQGTQIKRRVSQTVPDRGLYSSEQEEIEAKSPADLHLNITPQPEAEPAESGIHLSIPEEPVEVPQTPAPKEDYIIDLGTNVENKSVDLTLQSDGSVAGTETSAKVIPASVIESETSQTEQPIIIQKRGGVSPWLFYLLILVIIGGVGYLYYNFDLKFLAIEKQLAETKESIRTEIAGTVSFDRDVLILLAKKETKIYLLNGTPRYPTSFGKIIYSDEEQRGYIQLGSMPEIKSSEQKIFKVWVVMAGRNIPLSMPDNDIKGYEFIRLTGMPDISQNPVTEFLVTRQPVDDAKNPSSDVILRGEFTTILRNK